MVIKPTLNEADLKLLEKRFPTKEEQDKKFSSHQKETNQYIEKSENKILAEIAEFRNDFYEKIDPILKEVMASREERTIIAHHISELRDRVEKIEKHLGFPA